MRLTSRFFGRNEEETQHNALVANPDIENPLSLQLLFSEKLEFSDSELTKELRSFHGLMDSATCERDESIEEKGYLFGLVGWDKHVIRMVGFNQSMPSESLERCIAPSHYPQELKEKARNHKSHVLLYYAGYEPKPIEQYVALAALAGVLSKFGAIVVVNETAHTSFPAAALAEGADENMNLLRVMPLLLLYCGFVKYEIEDLEGVWMRTHGAHLLGMPDLATLAKGHNQGQLYFDMFSNILHYLLDSGAELGAGHTMQIDEDYYIRLREPREGEYFLESDGQMYIVELITQEQINR